MIDILQRCVKSTLAAAWSGDQQGSCCHGLRKAWPCSGGKCPDVRHVLVVAFEKKRTRGCAHFCSGRVTGYLAPFTEMGKQVCWGRGFRSSGSCEGVLHSRVETAPRHILGTGVREEEPSIAGCHSWDVTCGCLCHSQRENAEQGEALGERTILMT